MMTLEEAIEHAEYIVNNRKDAISVCWSVRECEQLAALLRELQEIRKDRDYWQEKAHSYEQTICKLTDAISAQPERKKGEWIEISSINHTYKCSECGRLLVNVADGRNNVSKHYSYCHCGADMRGEPNERY